MDYQIKILGIATGEEEDDVAAKGGVVGVLVAETPLNRRQERIVGQKHADLYENQDRLQCSNIFQFPVWRRIQSQRIPTECPRIPQGTNRKAKKINLDDGRERSGVLNGALHICQGCGRGQRHHHIDFIVEFRIFDHGHEEHGASHGVAHVAHG